MALHFNQRAQLGWPEGFSVVLGMQTEQIEVDELYCPTHEEGEFASNIFMQVIVPSIYHFP